MVVPCAFISRQAFFTCEELLHEAVFTAGFGFDEGLQLVDCSIPGGEDLGNFLLFGEWGEADGKCSNVTFCNVWIFAAARSTATPQVYIVIKSVEEIIGR